MEKKKGKNSFLFLSSDIQGLEAVFRKKQSTLDVFFFGGGGCKSTLQLPFVSDDMQESYGAIPAIFGKNLSLWLSQSFAHSTGKM